MKTYCVKQRMQTECVPGNERLTRDKNGRSLMKCICSVCGITKTRYVKSNTRGQGIGDAVGPIKAAVKTGQKISETLFPQTEQMLKDYYSGKIAKDAFNTKTVFFFSNIFLEETFKKTKV